MKTWMIFFTILATSLFGEKFECKQAVPAFDMANPSIQKGVFDPGSEIDIVEFVPSAQMYLVHFTPIGSPAIKVYCRPADLGKPIPASNPESSQKIKGKESDNKTSQDRTSLFNNIINFSPDLWETPIEGFKKANPQFKSLSQIDQSHWRTDAHLKFLEHSTYETVVQFENNQLHEVTILIFGRGDAKEDLSREEFDQLTRKVEASLNDWTQTKGMDAFVPSNTLQIKRRSWFKFPIRIDMDSNVTQNAVDSETNKRKFRAEFLRLTLTAYDGKTAPSELVKPIHSSNLNNPITKKADLKERIQHKNNDIFLQGIPMVDQGEKGYCVVASAERVMRYYGIDLDQNEIAKIANSRTQGGTSYADMFSALKKLGNQFRFSVREYQRGNDKTKLLKTVSDSIDQGYPILWGVELGTVKENPPIPQLAGGHMRLIIGYNKTDGKVIYSDSWGAKHEFKYMLLKDAYLITKGIYTISPN